jgi:glucose-1-phosphatase
MINNETKFDAIIFDLGGVIINLDIDRCYRAFEEKSNLLSSVEEEFKAHLGFFQDYERGLINDREFRSGLRQHFGIQGTDEEIDLAWKAMLLDIPADRIDLIRELGKKYRLFILSNTCQIHVNYFENEFAEANGAQGIWDLFERVYYSHETGFRKPQPEIYQKVLQENNLDPQRTVFIDDNFKNVESAKKLGIIAIQMEMNGKLSDYFLNL